MARKKRLILFFCLYGLLTAVILVGIFCVMNPLRQKLSAYEAAQPEQKSTQLFRELFEKPDWEKLYGLSGTADTLYEGASAYAAYMQDKVGDTQLTFEEVYTDLPDTHQYAVKLGEEKVAAFTLTGGVASANQIPQWSLGKVEICFERNVSVIVEKKPEHTVYINGVALDESATIRSVATKAEAYLPAGVHGYRLEQQYVGGLLTQPQVLVLDEAGNAVPVTRDPDSGIYRSQLSAPAEMTDEIKTLVKNAALADTKFAMRLISEKELQQYFDPTTELYAAIVANPIFIQKHNSSSIDEAGMQIGQYYRYSDDLFCANVKLTATYIRKDNTVKEYKLDKTYFFSRSGEGYLVTNYTNEAVQETVEQVRLTFLTGDHTPVSFMVDRRAGTVAVPEVDIPQGQELVGWATRTVGDSTITMTVRVLPDGMVLGGLEPMELHPVFQPIAE